MIEDEGLGGFARRVTANDGVEGLFRPRKCFFTQIAEPRRSYLSLAVSLGERTQNSGAFLLHCMSPLLAQSGHPDALNQCPLLGVKRTSA